MGIGLVVMPNLVDLGVETAPDVLGAALPVSAVASGSVGQWLCVIVRDQRGPDSNCRSSARAGTTSANRFRTTPSANWSKCIAPGPRRSRRSSPAAYRAVQCLGYQAVHGRVGTRHVPEAGPGVLVAGAAENATKSFIALISATPSIAPSVRARTASADRRIGLHAGVSRFVQDRCQRLGLLVRFVFGVRRSDAAVPLVRQPDIACRRIETTPPWRVRGVQIAIPSIDAGRSHASSHR